MRASQSDQSSWFLVCYFEEELISTSTFAEGGWYGLESTCDVVSWMLVMKADKDFKCQLLGSADGISQAEKAVCLHVFPLSWVSR